MLKICWEKIGESYFLTQEGVRVESPFKEMDFFRFVERQSKRADPFYGIQLVFQEGLVEEYWGKDFVFSLGKLIYDRQGHIKPFTSHLESINELYGFVLALLWFIQGVMVLVLIYMFRIIKRENSRVWLRVFYNRNKKWLSSFIGVFLGFFFFFGLHVLLHPFHFKNTFINILGYGQGGLYGFYLSWIFGMHHPTIPSLYPW